MRIKKYKGKIYGADLTSSEKKTIDIEISKQLSEILRKMILKLVP